MDLSEAELLVAIGRVFGADGPDVAVGPGDDAAVTTSGSGDLVLTTDALVEGVHFRRDLTTPRDLGYKAIAVNLSDLAAMAASPRYALCALTLSDDVDAAWVIELAGGMRECCDEFAVTLVGGNLARGRDVTIAVTATGEVVPGRGGGRGRGPPRGPGGGPRPGGGGPPGGAPPGSAEPPRGSASPLVGRGPTTSAPRSGVTSGPRLASGRPGSWRATAPRR